MEVEIQLDEKVLYYTNEDEVSGHVVLRSDTELDIATIVISLSGQATSRLDSRKLNETHKACAVTTLLYTSRLTLPKKLFQRNEQIFPPVNCAGWFTSGAVTMPPGEHSFPFSIMGTWDNAKRYPLVDYTDDNKLGKTIFECNGSVWDGHDSRRCGME
ncbi:hypothetical protein RIB2604_03102510 [Aspergillus luchuensis]|uniref:Arrestin-like N-terminal domain-containing protein n=1 Tax=Aspergillus kawachii TaxID=1069201 RepID=A0A146FWM4_ASPKA|nr:hypothetical protein RIB2604_03102510 [Aspergillus luchuensis]